MGKDVIVACDFAGAEEALAFLSRFTGRKPFVKIGMELFYAEGPSIVRRLRERGHQIFLDLKLHDIPNTVKKTMTVLRDLDVDLVNLHAAIVTLEARTNHITLILQVAKRSKYLGILTASSDGGCVFLTGTILKWVFCPVIAPFALCSAGIVGQATSHLQPDSNSAKANWRIHH